ncbi:hypothetical protein TEA_008834 [Camellia sinensis var. sinensis]|uniref:Fe2OG dioxygenase domain-containing protein n=1 Tax=Camellia sinensis var. sinensis TaxID=542762 RepID=A0A4S4E118_CAMSN|nr:hypothetical protein TEA_008834 [Camellia sinensis var. sinensis]
MKFGKVMEHMEHEVMVEGSYERSWKIMEYEMEEVEDEVAKAISRIIALALNLEVDFFDRQEMLGKPIANLRLLHYEGRVSDPMKGIYGAGAHSDFGLITLLATDDVFGLQICKDKDAKPQKWEFVAPLKGAFIVNLGDMLERWSNCIFRSTLHRVVGNGQERYSVRLHTLWSLVTIVFLNACPPASRKRTLPSKYQLNTDKLFIPALI